MNHYAQVSARVGETRITIYVRQVKFRPFKICTSTVYACEVSLFYCLIQLFLIEQRAINIFAMRPRPVIKSYSRDGIYDAVDNLHVSTSAIQTAL